MEWKTTTHLDQIELAPHSDLLQAPGHEGPGLSEVFFSVFREEHREGRLVRQAAWVLILPALGYRPVVDALMIPGLVLPVPLVLRHHHVIFGAVRHPCLRPIPHSTLPLPDLGRLAHQAGIQQLDDHDTYASQRATEPRAVGEPRDRERRRGGERGIARGRSVVGGPRRSPRPLPTHPPSRTPTHAGPWLRHRVRLPSRRRRSRSGC